jgi:hypothetical protein
MCVAWAVWSVRSQDPLKCLDRARNRAQQHACYARIPVVRCDARCNAVVRAKLQATPWRWSSLRCDRGESIRRPWCTMYAVPFCSPSPCSPCSNGTRWPPALHVWRPCRTAFSDGYGEDRETIMKPQPQKRTRDEAIPTSQNQEGCSEAAWFGGSWRLR